MTGKPNISCRFTRVKAPLWIGVILGVALVSLTGCRTTRSDPPVASLPETTVDPVSEVRTSATVEPAASSPETTVNPVLEVPSSATADAVLQEYLEQRWGMRIVGLYLSAGGFMLDFRYRVVDPEKAAPLFVRSDKPYLIDQASGRKFLVPNMPKVGPLRTAYNPERNRIYFTMFGNPGAFIKSGNKVTIVIGEFRVENLVVQ